MKNFLGILLFLTSTTQGQIKELDASNFDTVVLDHEKDVFVKFYAPWCGHCKQMAPEWERLAVLAGREGKRNLVIAKIDGSAHEAITERYHVYGFPALKLFEKSTKENPIDFNGPRKAEQLLQFVNANTR